MPTHSASDRVPIVAAASGHASDAGLSRAGAAVTARFRETHLPKAGMLRETIVVLLHGPYEAVSESQNLPYVLLYDKRLSLPSLHRIVIATARRLQ
jgi:hypothetical protein